MDAFIVVATSGELLIEKYYKNGANRSWIEEYISKLHKFGSQLHTYHETLHPVLLLKDKALIQLVKNDLLFIGVTRQEFPSVLLIETLQRISDNLGHYFEEPISEQLIKSHHSTVLALIEEMLVYGMPSILEPNALKMLVPQRSAFSHALDLISPSRLVANVMSAASLSTETMSADDQDYGQPGEGMGSGSGMGAGSGFLGCGSSVWWRRGPTKSTSATNQVLVDLVERLHCTVNRHGKILSSFITGDITIDSGLASIPHFKLILKNSQLLGHQPIMTFHPSVNTQKWKQDQTVSFIPPDGKFTLLQYSLVPPDLSTPLDLTGNFTFSDVTELKHLVDESVNAKGRKCKFELLLQPRKGFGKVGSTGSGTEIVLENVRLSILLPRWVTSMTTGEVSLGNVRFIDKQKTLIWSFVRFPLDQRNNFSAKCEGTLNVVSEAGQIRDKQENSQKQSATTTQDSRRCTTGPSSAVADGYSSSGSTENEAVNKEDEDCVFLNFLPLEETKQLSSTPEDSSDIIGLSSQWAKLYPSSSSRLNPKDLSFSAFLSFWMPQSTLSNISIDSMEISGSDPQSTVGISKLFRCATTAGKIEYRL